MAEALCPTANEVYLWHGTTPLGVLGIAEQGFRTDMAGAERPIGKGWFRPAYTPMYGHGVYFAECASKSDEYAQPDPRGMYKGCCALLLCRVTLGRTRTLATPNVSQRDVHKARTRHPEPDSLIGDRTCVGTYREFVIFDDAQCYPEYVVIYRRRKGQTK